MSRSSPSVGLPSATRPATLPPRTACCPIARHAHAREEGTRHARTRHHVTPTPRYPTSARHENHHRGNSGNNFGLLDRQSRNAGKNGNLVGPLAPQGEGVEGEATKNADKNKRNKRRQERQLLRTDTCPEPLLRHYRQRPSPNSSRRSLWRTLGAAREVGAIPNFSRARA